MGIPQVIMIVMLSLTLFTNVVKHHEPREGEYNGWATLIAIAIQVSILTWGGFFQKQNYCQKKLKMRNDKYGYRRMYCSDIIYIDTLQFNGVNCMEGVMEGQTTDPNGYCYLGERKSYE